MRYLIFDVCQTVPARISPDSDMLIHVKKAKHLGSAAYRSAVRPATSRL